MKYKEKIINYLKEKGITVSKVEQEKDNESVVCHILKSDNEKIKAIQTDMEKELDVTMMLSENFGMNVVIIESNNLE